MSKQRKQAIQEAIERYENREKELNNLLYNLDHYKSRKGNRRDDLEELGDLKQMIKNQKQQLKAFAHIPDEKAERAKERNDKMLDTGQKSFVNDFAAIKTKERHGTESSI